MYNNLSLHILQYITLIIYLLRYSIFPNKLLYTFLYIAVHCIIYNFSFYNSWLYILGFITLRSTMYYNELHSTEDY